MSSSLPPAKSKPGCSHYLPALLAVLLVITPIVFYSCDTELNKWKIAAATEELYSAGLDAAISSISQSLETDPDSPDLLFQRSKWYEITEQYDAALADIQRCIESAKARGWDPPALEKLEWHRAEILIDLQRFDDAEKSLNQIAEWNSQWLGENRQAEWNQLERMQAAMIRNNFAYFCARADRNIEAAAKDIDWAVKDYAFLDQNYQLCAVVYAELRQDELAAEMFSRVVEIAESKIQLAKQQLLKTGTDALACGVPLRGVHASRVVADLRDYQNNVATLRSALLARADLYERLHQPDKAAADRRIASQFGEAPVAKSKSQLTLSDIVEYLRTSAAYIDTRGCVRYRQGQFELALQDFNYALEIQRLEDVWSQQDHGRPFELIDPRKIPATNEYDRGRATLYYHRALTKRQLNDSRGAAVDEKKIRELGFEPSPVLF